jgi:hypothetical protein
VKGTVRQSLIRLGWVGLLAATTGCATTRPSYDAAAREALLSERAPPSGRACRISTIPATLPEPSDLVEEQELTAAIRDLLGDRQRDDDYVLFSMAYDRFGSNIRREVIEHNVPDAVADSVQKLVFALRKSLPEAEVGWGVRLRIDTAEPVTLRVGRQELCDPVPRDASLAYAIQQAHGPSRRVRGSVRETRLWIRLTVGPRGTVVGAQVERGAVGSTILVQQVLEYVRTFFFHPALEDGFPTTGTISVPITVRDR